MFSLSEQIIFLCLYLLSNSSSLLCIHLFSLSVPYFFPSPVAISLLFLYVRTVQFGITILLMISTVCQTLGVAVSPVVTHIVLVFVHHLLYSSVIVMNIRYCCLSELYLFLCDLQSIPNYLAVNYPVGTESIWAYVIWVAILYVHILLVAQCHAYMCHAGFVTFPCFCAGNVIHWRVQVELWVEGSSKMKEGYASSCCLQSVLICCFQYIVVYCGCCGSLCSLWFIGLQLSGLWFSGLQFSGLRFSGLWFSGLHFSGLWFSGLRGLARRSLRLFLSFCYNFVLKRTNIVLNMYS